MWGFFRITGASTQSMLREIVCFILVGAFAGLSFADDPKKPAAKPDPQRDRTVAPGRMSPEAIVDTILQRMDANKDGKISRSEAKARIADRFDAIDTNKDGYLDRQELLAMARRLAQMNEPGRPLGFAPGVGFNNRPDPLDFDSWDKNADGRLTRDELRGSRFLEVFDSIDVNKDGKIDPSEWDRYHHKK